MNEQTTLPSKPRSETSLPAVFGRLRDEIDQLFDDFSFAHPARSIFGFPGTRFTPAMEMSEKGDHYEVAVELPGLEEKDIDVECADGILTISGEKRDEKESRAEGYLMSERSYGAFRRQLTLPSDVDPDAIEAKFRSGVLRLKLKKDAQAVSRVRKIAIG